MKSFIVSILLGFSICFSFADVRTSLQITTPERSVWRVESPRVQGTSFFIESNTVVTSFDNIVPGREKSKGNGFSFLESPPGKIDIGKIVFSQKGNSSVLHVKEVIAISASRNLAVLKTKQSVVNYLQLRDGPPKASENLTLMVYSKGGVKEIKKRSSFPSTESTYHHRFFIDSEELSGSSGGPVLDGQKRVVGVFDRSFGGVFQLVEVIKADHIKALINGDIGARCFSTLTECINRDKKNTIKPADETKSPQTLYEQAMKYRKGEGVEKNFEKTLELLKPAAKQNYPPALYELAMILGVEKHPEALKMLKSAAEQGYPPALYELAIRYRKGKGVEKDPELSLKWLEVAAKLGHSQAQYELGMAYLIGKKGVEVNFKQGLNWIEKAKEQGHILAQKVPLSLDCYNNFN